MKLLDAIKQNKFKLTDKEKIVLQAIRDEGSFYEESLSGEAFDDIAFLGWYITKKDVHNEFDPAGVVSSLVKKGILVAADADGEGTIGYWIKYELDFAEDDWTIIFEEVR